MHKLLMVIRREYLERVRKKSFWIGVLVFPLITVGMVTIPMMAGMMNTGEQRKIALVDATGRLADPLRDHLKDQTLKNGEPMYVIEPVPLKGSIEATRKSLEPRVVGSELFGILTVGNDLDAKNNFQFYGKSVGNIEALSRLEHALQKCVVALRVDQLKVPIQPDVLERVTQGIDIESYQVNAGGEATQKGFVQTYFGTFGFVFILFMSMLLYGIAVMRGILEEKSNRIMEVLLGSLTPDQLMTGKILGIGLVGLTQFAVYMLTTVAVQLYIMSRGSEGNWNWLLDMLSPLKMLYFLIFFLLGYFMYTALFAAVGAVCNSEQEAQNLQAPVQYSLMIPMMMTFFFVQHPDSTAATIVSLIPLFTPMVMFMRISVLMPPFWQIALSIVLTSATILLLFKGAGKIFRIGVLMYGKRPTIPEIFRWARS